MATTKSEHLASSSIVVPNHISKESPELLIVSGLPRSGTSLMMQMLDAAGITIFSDAMRVPDENNPHGYFELAAVARLREDTGFLDQAVGKAVKIISPLLVFLPNDFNYRVIFLERDLGEVLASQASMLARTGQSAGPDGLEETYRVQVERAHAWAARNENVNARSIAHRDLIESPADSAREVLSFVGGWVLDRPDETAVEAMAAAVVPSLYRERHG